MRRRIQLALLLWLASAALAAVGSAAEPVRRVGFSQEEMMAHRIAGADTVRTRSQPGFDDSVFVRVVVGPDGRIVSAYAPRRENEDGPSDTALAVEAVRRWQFRPFDYRGATVAAVGLVEVTYRGPERWAHRGARFPEVDYSNLVIALERYECFGACPAYRVEIHGDGRVVFATAGAADPLVGLRGGHDPHNVLVPGRHESRIGRAELEALVARFRRARFFGLRNAYQARIEDGAAYVVSFATGGLRKQVVDYIGESAGMPESVRRLEEAIDRAAGTARWVAGDSTTAAALAAEGFDFESAAGDDMLYRAMAGAPERTLLDLLERKPSLERRYAPGRAEETPLGLILLERSIRFSRPRVFAELVRRGWLGRASKLVLALAFAEAAGGCDAAIAAALVGAGVAPDSRDKDGRTALISAFRPYPCGIRDPVDRPSLATALIRLGVPVNAADREGRTVLYNLGRTGEVELLLRAGARADVRSAKGLSPAFAAWSDGAALILLEAGADPRGVDGQGRTLRRLAREQVWPATLAWLDARGVG